MIVDCAECSGPADVLAWACGTQVEAGHVRTFLVGHPPPAGLGTSAELVWRWALAGEITERVVRVNAERAGVPDAGALRAEVVRCALAADPVTAQEVESCYRANVHLYRRPERRSVRYTVAPDRTEALATLRQLVSSDDGGASTSVVVADLGWVARGELSGPLEDAIFAGRPGRWRGPVQTRTGWHVVYVDRVDEAHTVGLERAEPQVRAAIGRARGAEAWAQWLSSHLASDVVMAPGVASPFGPGAFGSAHRH